ncbi:hypothetical protein [Paraburkholderia kirstenboschensis]|uniref:hypothetical protein n=1 Tax=Paraburkholderia kirstenboschensis TaxID=1245436 RepID=UPI000FFBDA2E|nr:hypothetical protein [Paraburkholderia kirstenboschensis]
MINGSPGCADHDDQFQWHPFRPPGAAAKRLRAPRQIDTGRQGCPHLRRAGAIASPDWSSFLFIRPRSGRQRYIDRREKESPFVERRVPLTALHWIEMFLRLVRPPAIAHSRLALAKARAILSLSLQ